MTPTEVALAYLASFSSGDPDRVCAWVTQDFANDQMGALGDSFSGRDLYRQRLAAFLGQFRDIRYTPGAPVSEGVRVAVPYVMTATDEGQSIELDGIMLITVHEGLVCARADYWDGLRYLQQMEAAVLPGVQVSDQGREGVDSDR